MKRTACMLIARLHDVGVELDEDDDTGPDRRPPMGADLGGFIASETFTDVRMRRLWKPSCY
jgi:hypothetical protein